MFAGFFFFFLVESIHLVRLTSHYVTQRGKIAENTVYACALLSAHTDTHGTKGEKGTISRMSDQANWKKGSFCEESRLRIMLQIGEEF